MMNKTLTTTSPEFVSFLQNAQAIVDNYRNARFPTLSRDVLVAEDAGPSSKYIRVVSQTETGTSRSVYCFVAKTDNTTKALGTVRCGDVLKAASWKAPARHARGNVFNGHSNGTEHCGPYGTEYLR